MRRPDASDRQAKLIMLTETGRDCVSNGIKTIAGIERTITQTLGAEGYRHLRGLLLRLLELQPPS